ncbi:MAG: hypothetical protein K6A40_06065 [Solobacterium sp.]|nr:hypothetical protein [Solobacterium sp.]
MKEKEKKDRYADYRKNADGSYEYTGVLYRYDDSMISWKKALTRLWTCTGACVLLETAAGCIPATGMVRTLYVLIPYIIGYCVTLYLCYKMIELSFSDKDLKEKIYDKTCGSFGAVTLVIKVMLAAGAAGEILRLFLETETKLTASLTVTGLLAMAFLMVYLFEQAESLMKFDRIEGKTAENNK